MNSTLYQTDISYLHSKNIKFSDISDKLDLSSKFLWYFVVWGWIWLIFFVSCSVSELWVLLIFLTFGNSLSCFVFSCSLPSFLAIRGDLGLAELWGDTWWVSGGLIEGIRTSVNVLLSRLWREREGRRAEQGVGVVGVHLKGAMPHGVVRDLK